MKFCMNYIKLQTLSRVTDIIWRNANLIISITFRETDEDGTLLWNKLMLFVLRKQNKHITSKQVWWQYESLKAL